MFIAALYIHGLRCLLPSLSPHVSGHQHLYSSKRLDTFVTFRVVSVAAMTIASSVVVVLASTAPAGAAVTINDTAAPQSSSTQSTCVFETVAENPHRSGSDVSVHGWWRAVSGDCGGKKAVVTTKLQSSLDGKSWVTRASANPTLSSGSAKASVARYACRNGLLTKWRGVVDVDIIGAVDSSDKAYNQQDVACGF